VEVSLAGLRLSSDAVDVLIRLLKSAVHVIQHGSEEDPGGLVLMA
jgi:hypothetical protein